MKWKWLKVTKIENKKDYAASSTWSGSTLQIVPTRIFTKALIDSPEAIEIKYRSQHWEKI